MPHALLLLLSIVAVFSHRPAAAASFTDAPLSPEVLALARRSGLDPAFEPTRFFGDLVRATYPSFDTPPPVLNLRANALISPKAPRIPVPLTAEVWSRVIFRETVTPKLLVSYVLRDVRAAYLARGLAALDDETLAYLQERPDVLRTLYERGAAAFAGFGHILHVRDGRVVLPGGDEAVVLWESVVHANVSDPERFVPALFGDSGGRLAYVVDAIAVAEPAAARFALGLWIGDGAVRASRFRVLVSACVSGFPEWRIGDRPFLRPLGDLAMVLLRASLDRSGGLAAPSDLRFWAQMLHGPSSALKAGTAAVVPSSAASATADEPVTALADGRIDAAWLLQTLAGHDMYARSDALDQFAFGQRLAAATREQGSDLGKVVSAFPTRRMLVLTLERMGAASLPTYLAALDRADALESSASRRFWTLAQYQAMLAVVARMRQVGLIEAADGEALVTSLSAVPHADGEYGGAMAEWLRTRGAQVLPPGITWEARLIGALSGWEDADSSPPLAWEGQTYRVDIPQADRQRIELVRAKQGGHTVDLAMELHAIAGELRAPGLTSERMTALSGTLRTLRDANVRALRRPAVNLLPQAVTAPRDGVLWVDEEVVALERAARVNDRARAVRASRSLDVLTDIVLGNALLSLVYAVELGDPDGSALLAGNVALRHDFGFGRAPDFVRVRQAWALPRQNFQPGVPWHVTGSALGLDLALASLSLRRLSVDRMAIAPKLPSTEREALAMSVVLLDPRRLTDADLAEVTAAIGRGRARVEALAPGDPALAGIAAELRMDGARERDLRWALEQRQPIVGSRFSLSDLLILGGTDRVADLDAWGMPAVHTVGCLCLRFAGSRPWRALEGRFQLPMVAATMGDLNLAVALRLAELRLPAALIRPVLTVAMQDFLDELSARHDSDWWALARQAQRISRERVEDYVAAAAAVNGPLVPDSSTASRD